MVAALALESGGAAPRPRPLRGSPAPVVPTPQNRVQGATGGGAVSNEKLSKILENSIANPIEIENAIQEALHRALDGRKKKVETIAAAARINISTAKSYFYDGVKPSGENLIALMCAFPEVFEAVVAMVGSSARYSMDPARLGRVLAGVE